MYTCAYLYLYGSKWGHGRSLSDCLPRMLHLALLGYIHGAQRRHFSIALGLCLYHELHGAFGYTRWFHIIVANEILVKYTSNIPHNGGSSLFRPAPPSLSLSLFLLFQHCHTSCSNIAASACPAPCLLCSGHVMCLRRLSAS